MSSSERSVISRHQTDETESASLAKYVVGFMGSLLLTAAAYVLVTRHVFAGNYLIAALASLAFLQFLLQMVCFLHIGSETKPRWKLLVLVFMVGIVLILVGGSIWIMHNLNYRMTPQQMNTYMKNQDGGI